MVHDSQHKTNRVVVVHYPAESVTSRAIAFPSGDCLDAGRDHDGPLLTRFRRGIEQARPDTPESAGDDHHTCVSCEQSARLRL